MAKKKEATGAIGYMLLFGMMLIMVIVFMYLTQVAKLMTHQHDIDDALADSTLAALVADDVHYFESMEQTGTPEVRFKSIDHSKQLYMDCMKENLNNTPDFYYDFVYEEITFYEVSGNQVKITKYSGNNGLKNVSSGSLGSVKTPAGKVVQDTSAYAKVSFNIRSILNNTKIKKYRDIYCTLEVN